MGAPYHHARGAHHPAAQQEGRAGPGAAQGTVAQQLLDTLGAAVLLVGMLVVLAVLLLAAYPRGHLQGVAAAAAAAAAGPTRPVAVAHTAAAAGMQLVGPTRYHCQVLQGAAMNTEDKKARVWRGKRI